MRSFANRTFCSDSLSICHVGRSILFLMGPKITGSDTPIPASVQATNTTGFLSSVFLMEASSRNGSCRGTKRNTGLSITLYCYSYPQSNSLVRFPLPHPHPICKCLNLLQPRHSVGLNQVNSRREFNKPKPPATITLQQFSR